MTIEFNSKLYRYDLTEPPKNWDDFFLNPEYDTKELGHKNKANLFFFTDSIDIAMNLGEIAAKKYSKTEYFLTTTETTRVNLIDFTLRFNIYQMLCLLQDLNLNILTKNFKTYENGNDFSQLRKFFDAASDETDSIKKKEIIENLKVHSNSKLCDIGLFGQRLTDFNNGIEFKKIVKENHPEIDGYIWREFEDPRGYTHCLFDAKKLHPKTTEKIEIKKVSS